MASKPSPSPSWPSPEPPLLTAFLDYLQAECGLSANTRAAYRRDLHRFLGFLAEQDTALAALTSRHIEAFVEYCTHLELSVATVGRHLAAVRMFCRFLVLQGVISWDVSSTVEAPKNWHRLPTVLDEQAVGELIAAPAAAGTKLGLRDQALLTLLYACGLRASELAGLKLTDCNFNVGVLRVIGKGSKERIIPLAPAAGDILQRYVRTDRSATAEAGVQTLLVSRTGKPLRREDVYDIVRRHARGAGTRGRVSPHTLRHCFATHMLTGGADLRIVQELLGHADISTTQIYTHVDADRLRAVHRKFHPRG